MLFASIPVIFQWLKNIYIVRGTWRLGRFHKFHGHPTPVFCLLEYLKPIPEKLNVKTFWRFKAENALMLLQVNGKGRFDLLKPTSVETEANGILRKGLRSSLSIKHFTVFLGRHDVEFLEERDKQAVSVFFWGRMKSLFCAYGTKHGVQKTFLLTESKFSAHHFFEATTLKLRLIRWSLLDTMKLIQSIWVTWEFMMGLCRCKPTTRYSPAFLRLEVVLYSP